jgi:hypothetical protein
VIRRAAHGSDPEGLTLGLAPQGECTGLQCKFDIVATIGLRLDLQHLLIEGAHLFEVGGHNRDECEFHQIFPSAIEVT